MKGINLNKFNADVTRAQKGEQKVSVAQVAEINGVFTELLTLELTSEVLADMESRRPRYLRFHEMANKIATREGGSIECNIAQIKRIINLSWQYFKKCPRSMFVATLEGF